MQPPNLGLVVSMESKNEKVSTTCIPYDISLSILSKLPFKSFKRFECVRKSWSLLFQNPHFINIFCNRCSYYNGSSFLLRDFQLGQDLFYSTSGQRFLNNVKLDFPNPFPNRFDFHIFGFGSINGTLCLYEDDGQIALWNPSTNTLNLIPPTPEELVESSIEDFEDFVSIYDTSYLHGFGYDGLINDYKIICYVCIEGEHAGYGEKSLDPLWVIYSLRTNSWREIDVFDMPFSLARMEGTQVYMDGVCHWLCEEDKDNLAEPCLVSFYLSNEVFFVTPISSNLDDCFRVVSNWINLAVLNGSIALISYHKKTTNFHISILGEIGVKESWTKLFIVGPLFCVERPIGVGVKGEIFFLRKDKEIAWVDLGSQMIKELGYKVMFPECRIIIYKESILQFAQHSHCNMQPPNFGLVSMESKNEMVSTTYIPDDISFSILSKLPFKSFKRFESVRKSWSLLFQNPLFINMFCNRSSYYNGSSFLLRDFQLGNDLFYSISGQRFQNNVKLDFSNPFPDHFNFHIFGFGSINGMLCLYGNSYFCKIVLWNPSTNTINLIPPTPEELVESSCSNAESSLLDVEHFHRIDDESYLHGFGYDDLIDDYKIICYVTIKGEHKGFGYMSLDPFWEIYSLKTNSWRIISGVDMPYSLSRREGSQVYMDGVCHWLCEEDVDCLDEPCLVSFYLSNELSFITRISSDLDDCFDDVSNWINLAVLNGSIALISYHEKTTNFHISILGEFGVKESWTKLFIVGPLSCIECPIGLGAKGEIFFIRKDKEVAWVDLCSQMIKELGYKVMFPECRIIIYKESILPIGEISC